MSLVQSVFLNSLVIFSECIILLILFSSILNFKKKNKYLNFALFFLLNFVSLEIASRITTNIYFQFVLFLIPLAMILFFITSNKLIVVSFTAIVGVTYLKLLDTLIIFLTTKFMNISGSAIFSSPETFFSLSLFSKTIEFIIAILIVRFFKSRINQSYNSIKYWLQSLLLPIVTCVLLISCLEISLSDVMLSSNLILSSAVLFVLSMIQFFVLNSIDSMKFKEQKMNKEKETLNFEISHLKTISQAFEEQRKLTHEFNNQLSIINTLINQNKNVELKTFINSISDKLENNNIVVYTNNVVIDAVLNRKYNLSKEKNIVINFDLQDLSSIENKSTELAVVLSNLLDNAITAASEYGEKTIVDITCKISGDYLILKTVNPTKNNMILEGERLMSVKRNSYLHGYGLINVKAILNTMLAEYAINNENSVFTFVAMIPTNNFLRSDHALMK